MKCKRCGKVEGFDGSFHTLYCQSCLNELLKEEVDETESFSEKQMIIIMLGILCFVIFLTLVLLETNRKLGLS